MLNSEPQNKIALVTGASTGIGLEFARLHAKHKGHLILVARRKEKLLQIKADLETRFGIRVYVLAYDLSLPNACEDLYQEIKNLGLRVDYLINNAGLGDLAEFSKQSRETQEQIMTVNMAVPTRLMRLFIPDMQTNKFGRVLNVASMAGFLAGPFHALYYASKAYLLSLSEAVSEEIQKTEVTLTTVCPGPTQSDFFDAAHVPMDQSKIPTALSVAEYGYFKMLEGAGVVIPGKKNQLIIAILKFLPRKLPTKLSAKRLSGFLKKTK